MIILYIGNEITLPPFAIPSYVHGQARTNTGACFGCSITPPEILGFLFGYLLIRF
jgi:hypothetical protein